MSTTPEDLAAFPNRYAVEREIEAAENPAPGTMLLNDGHERVRLPGGTLRRMLAVIDRLAAMASSAQQGAPVAWCALTPSGKIAHFDGKPMVMPGPVGNEHHTVPMFTGAAMQANDTTKGK